MDKEIAAFLAEYPVEISYKDITLAPRPSLSESEQSLE